MVIQRMFAIANRGRAAARCRERALSYGQKRSVRRGHINVSPDRYLECKTQRHARRRQLTVICVPAGVWFTALYTGV